MWYIVKNGTKGYEIKFVIFKVYEACKYDRLGMTLSITCDSHHEMDYRAHKNGRGGEGGHGDKK